MKGKQSSLYIHIPFCVKKCIYCDFLSVPYDEALAAMYMEALITELHLHKDEAGTLQTVYVGGGTPTTMPYPSLIRLMTKIMESFPVAHDAEITIEANPGTLNKEKIRELSDAGINRLSIGVQSFDNDKLRLLGRIHSSEDARSAVEAARDAGVANISVDFIYGIPGQSADAWSHTLSTALELSPEHISAYELTIEKATPLCGLIAQKRIELPHEDIIVGMYYSAIDRMQAAGYDHYEISNFSKPGFECRHNLNYWNRGRYIGVGAGAHSFTGNKRWKNTGDIEKYIGSLREGKLPAEELNELRLGDSLRESVFLGLRKTGGLRIDEFADHFAVDIADTSKELIAGGLLESQGGRLRLTRRGIVISNAVIAELFETLEKNGS